MGIGAVADKAGVSVRFTRPHKIAKWRWVMRLTVRNGHPNG
ncbi:MULTISPECIES: hypothetical protein [Streptomyces violaceusniger group]|uniref:Transposase n=2 Tax=Streptomyces rhizosphaericus TaxID=114699 RepID=A0ABN1SD23_9ACTN|nr:MULTISPECIES: hypothetical protein [Streptomyces violaceusniger group]